MGRKTGMILAAGLLLWGMAGCSSEGTSQAAPGTEKESVTAAESEETMFTAETYVRDVIQDPAFGDYGRLLFPVDRPVSDDLTLEDVGDILTWYSYVNPDKTVEIVNYLKGQALSGEQIFYDIYTEEEKEADPDKEDTGLFFFQGTPGETFAITNAGGGFVYVGAMHDSFPHALELSKRGYNAFALIYRPGAQTACEDLARAIAFIHEHAEELEVDVSDYSLWGGSAGARMAAWLGSYGTAAFGEESYPGPGAVIMQYTGLSGVTGTEPPTYACVGTKDGIADYRTMEERISQIRAQGVNAEIEVFDGLPHGFGLGEGTVAEGWFDRAVQFWEDNRKEKSSAPAERQTISGQIPEELARIPQEYFTPASEQGTVERLEYQTYESMSYESGETRLEKTAYVYLPKGYSEEKQYNVLYLMHGGWSNETTYLGTPEDPHELKNILDHAIQDGKMEPVIVVCPTYNNTSPEDSADYRLALRLTDNYHNELVNDLLPAVEGKYSTYAAGTSPRELKESRDHRAFAGFSMGSVTTWHTFQYAMDYFRYFLPSSGNMTTDGAYLESLVTDAGYGPEDFFIYAMSGTEDFAYSAFSLQIMAMLDAPGGTFISAANETEGNLAYLVQEGNAHDGNAALQYIYNGLIWLWAGEKTDGA